MAQITYRANLSAKVFPFISDNWGRTVIVPQYDNTFNRELSSQEDPDRDVGIPQAYYMHNVMPTSQGFQSVGYSTVLSASPSGTFTDIFLLTDAADNKAYLGVATGGQLYINTGIGWILKGTYVYTGDVTTAYVSGVTYIYLGGYGCITYDFSGAAFVAVTLTALDITKVLGICGALGYLIAWNSPVSGTTLSLTSTIGSADLTGATTTGVIINQPVSGVGIPSGSYVVSINPGVSVTINQVATANGTVNFTFAPQSAAVAWSSTIDPTDFTPSLTTGAGGGSVEGARGAITYCLAHTLGFIVYTTVNAVAAVYSNNARYPFAFRELLSSGGLSSQSLVGYDANTGNHYAYTTSGFQLISTSQSQTVFPEMTDFIAGKLFEDYNESTGVFSRTVLSAAMQKKLHVVSDRYLVVSYGTTSLTHAIVYDISTRRFGKLKIPHVAVLEYQLTSAGVTEIPRQSLALLQSDGTLKIVDFSAYSATSNGVLALGKYQFVRARLMTLDTISVENIYYPDTFTCTILSSINGKTQAPTNPDVLESADRQITYGSRASGINHALVFKGSFLLESLVLQFHIHGKR
jgi:hypothetical protein